MAVKRKVARKTSTGGEAPAKKVGRKGAKKGAPGGKLTLQKLADFHGISLSALNRLKAKGVDVYTAKEVQAYLANRANPGKPAGEVSPNLEAARLRKVDLDCELLQIKIDRELGKLVERDVVDEVLLRLGLHSRQCWDRIADDLPPMLEGLSAPQMKKKLMDYGRARQVELSEGHGLDD